MSPSMVTALQVVVLGLAGVFIVLILFYVITRLLIAVAKKLPPEK